MGFPNRCFAPGSTRNDWGTSRPCLFPPLAVKSKPPTLRVVVDSTAVPAQYSVSRTVDYAFPEDGRWIIKNEHPVDEGHQLLPPAEIAGEQSGFFKKTEMLVNHHYRTGRIVNDFTAHTAHQKALQSAKPAGSHHNKVRLAFFGFLQYRLGFRTFSKFIVDNQ